MACYRAEADAIILHVRLTPRADRDAIDGVGRLADGREMALARVRAVPEDGAANAALEKLLAKTFRRPKSAVRLIAGGTGRIKQIRIAGEPAELTAVVAAWPAKQQGSG